MIIEPLKVFLSKINEYRHMDGYKLVAQRQLSGYEVFSWNANSFGQDYGEGLLLGIECFLYSEYVMVQISEMEESVEARQYLAIVKAKELIETTCKSLLDVFGITYGDKTDLLHLGKVHI